MKSALDIAHDAQLQPITDVASKAGIQPQEIEQFGRYRGKVQLPILDRLAKEKDGRQNRPQTQCCARPVTSVGYPTVWAKARARHHPRQEPGAVVPHAGICVGGGPTPLS